MKEPYKVLNIRKYFPNAKLNKLKKGIYQDGKINIYITFYGFSNIIKRYSKDYLEKR